MSDLSVALADDITEALFKNTGPSLLPVASVYVTLFNDSGAELASDLQNGRVETIPSDWTLTTSNSVDNANRVDFGESLADLTQIRDVALYDSANGGTELARYELDNVAQPTAPDGTNVFFAAGELSFDILDHNDP